MIVDVRDTRGDDAVCALALDRDGAHLAVVLRHEARVYRLAADRSASEVARIAAGDPLFAPEREAPRDAWSAARDAAATARFHHVAFVDDAPGALFVVVDRRAAVDALAARLIDVATSRVLDRLDRPATVDPLDLDAERDRSPRLAPLLQRLPCIPPVAWSDDGFHARVNRRGALDVFDPRGERVASLRPPPVLPRSRAFMTPLAVARGGRGVLCAWPEPFTVPAGLLWADVPAESFAEVPVDGVARGVPGERREVRAVWCGGDGRSVVWGDARARLVRQRLPDGACVLLRPAREGVGASLARRPSVAAALSRDGRRFARDATPDARGAGPLAVEWDAL